MTASITSLSAETTTAAYSPTNRNKQPGNGASNQAGTNGDVVSISDLARAMQAANSGDATASSASDEAQTEGETLLGGAKIWADVFNIKAGTTMLSNGHKQVVTIKGNSMELYEYDGDKLVRKETGSIVADRISRDIEFYDKKGKVSQTTHLELSGFDAGDAKTSKASLVRDIQWFDNGEATRELHEKMDVAVNYERLNALTGAIEPTESLLDLVNSLTVDTLRENYTASIMEYSQGTLTREATVISNAEATSETNRSDGIVDGKEAHSSEDVAKRNKLAIHMRSFDQDGNLLKEDIFKDQITMDGGQRQSVSSSWYDKGELVRHTQGEFSVDEAKNVSLSRRPDLYKMFGLEEDEYSAAKPLNASRMLTHDDQALREDGDLFTTSPRQEIADNGYDIGRYFDLDGDYDNAYSLSWTTETYADGELAARSVDSVEAKENPRAGMREFQTLVGLTEPDAPALLRRSTHVEEAYEDGELTRKGEMIWRESVEDDERGVARLTTHLSADVSGADGARRHAVGEYAGGLDRNDKQFTAALDGMRRSATLALGDALDILEGNVPDARGE